MLPLVVEYLKEYFPEQAGNVVWAILHDELAMQCFGEKPFVSSLLNKGLNLENWRSGSLARICLYHQEEYSGNIRIDANNYLSSQLARIPFADDQMDYSTNCLKQFALMGACAEELLRIVTEGGWDELSRMLGTGMATFPDITLPGIRTILVYFSHLLNDPSQLIGLLSRHLYKKEVLELCTFIYCSYYFEKENLERRLFEFLTKISFSYRIDVLKYLLQQQKQDIVCELARQLLENEEDFNSPENENKNSLDEIFSIARQYYRLALLELSENQQEGEHAWVELEKSENTWKTGLLLQKVQTLNHGNEINSLQTSFDSLQNDIPGNSKLINELWSFSNLSGFAPPVQISRSSPFVLIQKYKKAYENQQIDEAEEIAEQIIDSLKLISDDNSDSKPKYLFKMEYDSIIEDFLSENDLDHAEQAANILAQKFPAKPGIIKYLSEIKEKQGSVQEALDYKIVESAFHPEDPALIKSLSTYYYKCGEINKAVQEYKKLFEIEGSLNDDERLKLAEMAYESGDYSCVEKAAGPLLDDEATKGMALTILGKTRMVQGYFDEAVSFFRRAVEENPYSAERWLYLSESCRKDTSEERDIPGILLEGLNYLPKSATLHGEIAQSYYRDGKISDAIDYLQKAASMTPDTKESVITIGSLMTSMGDEKNAFDYYQKAQDQFEFDKDIARLSALSAMDNENYEAAEKVLTSLFRQIKPSADDIATYVLARLKGKSLIFSEDLDISTEELSNLKEKLNEAYQQNPEHLGINLLRAELLAYIGDYEKAREVFKVLIEHENTSHWKTLGGYGFTSFKMDDVHTAIAALQESYSINPEQNQLEKYLAEAYQQAGLFVDAKYFADKIFNKRANDHDTLLWYADLNGKMGDWDKVIPALHNAYNLNPGDSSVMMRLAESYVRSGRNADASKLAKLLLGVPDLDSNNLVALANLLAQMGEWLTVNDLLGNVLEKGYSESAVVYLMLSLVNQKLGDIEKALQYTQKAMIALPENYYLYIYQSDLFYLLDKHQSALSCLDFSDNLLTTADESIFEHPIFSHLDDAFSYKKWLTFIREGDGILFRRVLSLRKLNKYDEAYNLVKNAYSAVKTENKLVLLMDLAIRTANFGSVKALVKDSKLYDKRELNQVTGLLNLRMNILLDNVDGIRKLMDAGKLIRFNTSEWYCAQSIISKWDNDWDTANQYYKQAKTVWLNNPTPHSLEKNIEMSGYDFFHELLEEDPYWVWDVGAGLLLWDEALPEIEKIAKENPDHMVIQFELMKLLTLAGEWIYLSEELEIEKHKPYTENETEAKRELVQNVIKMFEKGLKEPGINRWITRANIVHSKKPVDIKQVSDQLQMPEDLEFLVGYLRKEKKYTPAAEIAGKLDKHFKSVWQKAMCYRESDNEKGIELLNSEIDQYKGFPLQYIALGQAYEISGDYENAYQSYRQALKIWKDEPVWHTHCAELAGKCGDESGTIFHYTKALDLGYKKLDTAKKLANIYQKRNEFQKTIDILTSIYEEDILDFSSLMQLASASYEIGDTNKAFDYAEHAKTIDPGSEEPYLLYAQISEYLGQQNAAMEYVRKALELKPEDEDILILLCNSMEKAGNPDEAYQLLEDVIVKGNAGQTVIGEYVKRKYYRHGSKAVLTFLENLKEKGSFPEEMHSYLAEAYFEEKQMNKAEQEALAAIKFDAELHKINQILAVINHKKGQLDLASHYAAQAIQSCPAYIDAYLELADIYNAKNETAKALEVYKQAISSNPENYLVYFHAGLLLRETRDYQESEIMLKQAAKLVPNDLNIRRQLGAVVALNMVHHAQEEKIVP